jgi:hypothetical protein
LRTSTFIAQESYYLLTGIWPIIHIGSFMAVTGYKTDIWLVKMVAFLSVTIGIQLLKRRQSEIVQYNNSAFLFADRQLLSLHGTISEIYLIGAMV